MTLQRLSHAGSAPATGLSSSITSAAMSIPILSGTGYPTGSGGPFTIAIDQGLPTEEHILCSSLSGSTITVSVGGRGYDNTTAASHNAGATNVELIFTAAEADDDNAHIYTPSRNDHTQYVLYSGITTGNGIAVSGSGTATNLAASLPNVSNVLGSTSAIGNGSFTAVAGLTGLNSSATYLVSIIGMYQTGGGNALVNQIFSTTVGGSQFGPPMQGYLVSSESLTLSGVWTATGSTSYYLCADANTSSVSVVAGSGIAVVRIA